MIAGCPMCVVKPAAFDLLFSLYTTYRRHLVEVGDLGAPESEAAQRAMEAATRFDIAVEVVAAQSGRSMAQIAQAVGLAYEGA